MNHPSRFTSAIYTGSRGMRHAISLLAVAGVLWGMLHPAFAPSVWAQGPAPTSTPAPAPRSPSGGPNAYNYDLGNPAAAFDPVSASNGAYMFGKSLFALGGPLPLNFDLYYHTNLPPSRASTLLMNFGWSPMTNGIANSPGISGTGTTYTNIRLPNGNIIAFKKVLGSAAWALVGAGELGFADNGSRIQYALKETPHFFYLMDPVAGLVYIYTNSYGVADAPLDPRCILDRNHNTLTFTFSDGKPTRIDDGLGRRLDLTFAYISFLETVTDQNGRQVTFTYDPSGADNGGYLTLRSVTDPMSRTTTFGYAGGFYDLVAAETLPRGNKPISNTYASGSRNVISQRDAYSNTTIFTKTGMVMAVQAPDGNIARYQHTSNFSPPKAYTDTTNAAVNLTKNGNNQITSITDRFGDTTSATFHAESGKLASVTNAKGNTLAYTYTAQDQTFTNPISPTDQVTFTFYNLTRVDYPATAAALRAQRAPRAASEQFTYDARGNILTHTDQAGQVWTYTYNARGQVLTATSPTGGVATNTYNADATLASTTDSDPGIGATTFGYDAYKRLNRITHPDATFVQIAYDLDDEITSITDENNRAYTYAYDTNGNLTAITDPAGQVTNLAYDLMDRVTQIADRLNKTTTLAYDALGRAASTTDATGVAESYGYDSRSNDSRTWLNRTTRAGQSWLANYDAEGLVASLTTPLSHTTTFARDKLGNVTGVTDPLGHTTTLAYDALNRLTGVTDPFSRTTAYGYDARDLLTSVTAPVVGTVTYQRDAAGNLTRITDLNGRNWNFGYSANGRLTSQTDPLTRTTTQAYDQRGRAGATTFPDSATLTPTYDAADNLTNLNYSGGLNLNYTYDNLDRLTTTNNLTLGYDAEGRITNTQDGATAFGATYDDAGRLKTATYNGGALVVTYTYSATSGVLTRVSDSRGTQIDFTYDQAFQLVGLNRSNGVNATFTRDQADRVTRIQDGAVLDLQYTLDAANQVTQLQMTAPLDPASNLQSPTSNFTYDAASQINTAGYAYDARGRQTAAPGTTYTWDGASRLTGVNTTTLTYTGLDDVRTRTSGGTTTHYYYNYALGLTSIVAETQESVIRDQGSGGREQNGVSSTEYGVRNTQHATRYYIYTPGGALLYAIDAATNQPSFYHFDRTGSTLALTDNSGNVTDAYAYDPYGKLLAHTGANPQPFTYVGQWGVRQESATLYQMRARYYDAATQRFLSREPLWTPVGDAQQTNPYGYAYNNPIQYVDAKGLAPVSLDDLNAINNEIEGLKQNLAVLEGGTYLDDPALNQAYANLNTAKVEAADIRQEIYENARDEEDELSFVDEVGMDVAKLLVSSAEDQVNSAKNSLSSKLESKLADAERRLEHNADIRQTELAREWALKAAKIKAEIQEKSIEKAGLEALKRQKPRGAEPAPFVGQGESVVKPPFIWNWWLW